MSAEEDINWKRQWNFGMCHYRTSCVWTSGSSTGGFTDCMLQNGAVKVYAIDVGTNQLAWKLRQDERVVSMEKTRYPICYAGRYCRPD